MQLHPPDLHRWARALTTQPTQPDGLMNWVTGPLRDFFPFERAYLAHGEQVAGQIRITHQLAHGHDPAFLDRLGAFPIEQRGCLIWWVDHRRPFCIDPAAPPPYATPLELEEISTYRLGRIGAHGVVNASNSTGTYFSFAGLPEPCAPWHLDALTLIAPVLNDLMIKWVAHHQRARRDALAALPPRHQHILRELADGHCDKQIAARLGIAEKTVRNQLSDIYDRLGVRSRAQAIALLR